MAKKVTEHDALKGVDLLLEQLSDEEKQRVFDWIVLKHKVAVASPTGSSTGRGTSTNPPGNTAIPADIKIKEFIALKKPEGFYERIACLAYYLEKYENKEGIKTIDITQANTDAKQTKLPDSSVYVNNAAKKEYGLLISIGKGKKSLSAKGEALVDALPDREKVGIVLQEHSSKKKTSKKRKKSKA